MSGCNCKSEKNVEINLKTVLPKYFIKFIGFLLMLCLIPLINVAIVWFMFQTLVLNKDVDVKSLLIKLLTSFKKENDDNDEDDDHKYEYELTNVEEIKK